MDGSNIPTSKFIFIFICNNEVILDQDENLPSESVHDSESGTYSWNEMAINITKKVFNCFTVTHLLVLRPSILALFDKIYLNAEHNEMNYCIKYLIGQKRGML